MVYLVTWILIEFITIPCSINELHYDEYGICNNQFSQYALLCYDEKKKEHKKVFSDRGKAEAFIKNAPSDKFGASDYCEGFTIDSVDIWLDY